MKSYDICLLLSIASILDLLQSISHLLWVLWLKLLISQDSPCPRLIMSSIFSNQPFIPPCALFAPPMHYLLYFPPNHLH